ncbi:MAG: hypothetical protein ACRC6V_06670 [Bacteroidales bacterium]
MKRVALLVVISASGCSVKQFDKQSIPFGIERSVGIGGEILSVTKRKSKENELGFADVFGRIVQTSHLSIVFEGVSDKGVSLRTVYYGQNNNEPIGTNNNTIPALEGDSIMVGDYKVFLKEIKPSSITYSIVK